MQPLTAPAQAAATVAHNNNRTTLKKVFGPLTLDNVKQNDRKADRYSAQVRQVVETAYPSGRAGNSAQPSIFAAEAFGFKDTITKSTRVAWIDVPKQVPMTDAQGQPIFEEDGITFKLREITMADVLAQLAHYPNAGIQLVQSDDAILTEEQVSAIEAGLTTLAIIKYGTDGTGGQLVRYGINADGSPKLKNDGTPAGANEMVPGPNGREQFQARYFKPDMTLAENQDKDLRQPKQVSQPGAPGVYGTRADAAMLGQTLTPATPTRFNVVEQPTNPSTERALANPEPLIGGQGNNPAIDGPEVRGQVSDNQFVQPATQPGDVHAGQPAIPATAEIDF